MRAEDLDQPGRSDSVGPPRPGARTEERLRRRLERERRARLDAERISEAATRELYEGRAELALFERIFVTSNEASSIQEAMQVVIDAVCAHTGWPVGHVYMRGEGEPPELVPTTIWRLAEPDRFDAFRRITEQMRFSPGIGLPGRVLASGRPAWIVDVTKDSNFPRAKQALDIGVRAGFAFPVLVGEEVAAVLEFFSSKAIAPMDGLLERMANVGTQLGLVIQRKRAQEEREELHHRMEVLLSSAGEGIYGIDIDGTTTFANPAAARMLGWPGEELIGRPLHDVAHGARTDSEAHDADECPLHAPLTEGVDQRTDSDTFSRRDGTQFPVDYIATCLPGPTGTVVTFKDVTERKRFESQLLYLADHDPLTGLFNRRRFEQELETMIAYARRYRAGAAALILDLDNFKVVNDTRGHRAGDDLILSLAALLRDRMRRTDVIARLGGDEFAVLLPQVGAPQAQRVAAELVEIVRHHVLTTGGHPIRVTTSAGLALLDEEELTAEEILVRADTAMYAAKEAGGDRFALYAPEHARHLRLGAALPWSKRIHRALAEDRFVMYYQPILDLASNDVSQIELLLRMYDDEGELMTPQAFLPAAERFDLMEEIDSWVTRSAIRLLAERRAAGQHLNLLVQVNLSAKSLGSNQLPKLIQEELAGTGIDPSCLIFEVTETAAIGNIDEARRFADRLTTLGCRLALDDFGSGFSSFYSLKYLPLAYLKIDGEFISGLARSPIDQRVVRAMVDVARGLGLQTIGEFVEEAATLELLREYGIDYAQGYYIGRPRPVADLGRDAAVVPRHARSLPDAP